MATKGGEENAERRRADKGGIWNQQMQTAIYMHTHTHKRPGTEYLAIACNRKESEKRVCVSLNCFAAHLQHTANQLYLSLKGGKS